MENVSQLQVHGLYYALGALYKSLHSDGDRHSSAGSNCFDFQKLSKLSFPKFSADTKRQDGCNRKFDNFVAFFSFRKLDMTWKEIYLFPLSWKEIDYPFYSCLNFYS